jgi:hypothetical protein
VTDSLDRRDASVGVPRSLRRRARTGGRIPPRSGSFRVLPLTHGWNGTEPPKERRAAPRGLLTSLPGTRRDEARRNETKRNEPIPRRAPRRPRGSPEVKNEKDTEAGEYEALPRDAEACNVAPKQVE